jgi:hypothetical protein
MRREMFKVGGGGRGGRKIKRKKNGTPAKILKIRQKIYYY